MGRRARHDRHRARRPALLDPAPEETHHEALAVQVRADVFGVDDLARAPKRTTGWEGVRNYQARNMLRDDIKTGDLGFFYHSSCAVPGIAGVVRIARAGYPTRLRSIARASITTRRVRRTRRAGMPSTCS
jgi:hypothetical protein